MATQSDDDKKRRDPYEPRTGATRNDPEPSVPNGEADLDDDQADSGPDRDHAKLSG
jgi:hypothetical protein